MQDLTMKLDELARLRLAPAVESLRAALAPATLAIRRALIKLRLAQSARAVVLNQRRITNDLTAHLLYPQHRGKLAVQIAMWRAEIASELAYQSHLKAELEAMQ